MRGVFRHLVTAMARAGQVLVNLGLVHRDGEWLPYWQGWLDWMRAQGWRRFGLYVWDQGPGLRILGQEGGVIHAREMEDAARGAHRQGVQPVQQAEIALLPGLHVRVVVRRVEEAAAPGQAYQAAPKAQAGAAIWWACRTSGPIRRSVATSPWITSPPVFR
jgi:hypothetical protein